MEFTLEEVVIMSVFAATVFFVFSAGRAVYDVSMREPPLTDAQRKINDNVVVELEKFNTEVKGSRVEASVASTECTLVEVRTDEIEARLVESNSGALQKVDVLLLEYSSFMLILPLIALFLLALSYFLQRSRGTSVDKNFINVLNLRVAFFSSISLLLLVYCCMFTYIT